MALILIGHSLCVKPKTGHNEIVSNSLLLLRYGFGGCSPDVIRLVAASDSLFPVGYRVMRGKVSDDIIASKGSDMTKVEEKETLPMVINLPPALEMDEEQFFEFCRVNSELRIERTASEELIIMPPTGGETSDRNAELTTHFWTAS